MNQNGLGVIVWDNLGGKIWASLGPFVGMPEQQALMWGIQLEMMHAVERVHHRVHTETVNRNLYDNMRLQEFIFLQDDLVEAFKQFNTF